MPLLQVNDLHTYFFTEEGLAKAVDGVSFSLEPAQILGVVGESGCGKSVMARSILKLIPDPPGRIVGGQILLEGMDLIRCSEKKMQEIRGNEISMIFQEPMTALNAVFTIGDQISEVFRVHQKLDRKHSIDRAIEMLKKVGIPSPHSRIRDYPFQLSGGMRQRIMIAMALACAPKVILADEPSTALDVTIQAQILELLCKLQTDYGTSLILISHDLGVIAETVDDVLVMYTGKIVEQACVKEIFTHPLHPYTEGLLSAMPSLDSGQDKNTGRLKEIKGIVPDLCHLPSGCAFSPRCRRAQHICSHEPPPYIEVKHNHHVRCWLYS